MAVSDKLYDTGGAVYNVHRPPPVDPGAAGDGVTDDSALFYNLTPGRHYVVPAGTYRFAQSGTISSDVTLEFKAGALIAPDVGVDVAVLGPVIAAPFQWIAPLGNDAAGRVLFFTEASGYRANRFIADYLPQWWGVKGDGIANDQPALTRMVTAIPDYCAVRFASQMVMRLATTWTVSNRDGIVFYCEADPRNVGSNGRAAAFKYDGATAVRAVVFLDRCRFCTMRGFSFDAAGLADACIDLDGYGDGIGTACTIEHNLFGGASRLVDGAPVYNPGFVGVGIARSASATVRVDNQEYHTVARNVVYGGQGNARGLVIDSTSAPTVVTGPFVAEDAGTQIRIARASAQGGALETTIVSVDSQTTPPSATLADAPSGLLEGRFALVGSALGVGVLIGTSANAKKILIEDNNIIGCRYGIRAQGGSFHALHNSFSDNDVNISVTNLSEPSYDEGSNSERSRQHLDLTAGTPYAVRNGRFDVSNTPPDGAYLNLPTTNPVLLVGCATENGLSDSSSHLIATPHGNKLVSMSNLFSPPVTMAQLGVGVDFRWVSLFDQGITDKPGDSWLGSRVFSSYADYDGTITGRSYSSGSSFHTVAVRGEAMVGTNGTAYRAKVVGLQAAVGRGGPGTNAIFRGVEVVLPQMTNQQAYLVEGLYIQSPDMVGESSAARATGIVIEPMKPAGSGIIAGWGIDQQGPADLNRFAGPTIQAAPDAAVADALLAEGQMAFYRDEASGELRVRVKYADSSVHEGTIALLS